MLETVGNLVRYIVIIIFLGTILEMVLPQGVFRRYLRMLMGILLILTLLTPLQKIMRMGPHWGAPVLSGAPAGDAALNDILQKGEVCYRDNIDRALQEYQKGIFSLLEGELSREFGQKLQRLEVSMEEDLTSQKFGSLQSIYAEVREVQAPVHAETGGKVKEIRITVEVDVAGEDHMKEDSVSRGASVGQTGAGTQEVMGDQPAARGNGQFPEKNGQSAPAGDDRLVQEKNSRPANKAAAYEKEGDMRRFIAAYFQLPLEKVAVKILP